MMLRRALYLLFMGLLVSGPVVAQDESSRWVEVSVNVPIHRDDLASARSAAREEAIRQALLMQTGRMQSSDEMVNGKLTKTSLNVQGDWEVGRVVPVSEESLDVWLQAGFRVQLISRPICSLTPASGFRKRVVFTRFPLLDPDGAGLGGLSGSDLGLPANLMNRLRESRYLIALDGTHWGLFEDPVAAPTRETVERQLTQAVEVAESMGAQFVVSGVIRSLAVRSPDVYRDSAWSNLLRVARLADEQREFVVDVFVHDGFSGALVYNRRYHTSGRWDQHPDDDLSLGGGALLKSDYGRAVDYELERIARDVQAQVACQPFMTRIRRVEGKELLFESGAQVGFKPGDVLQVYRTRQLYDGVRYQGTELKEVQLALQVTQVQPDFSIGRLKVDPSRYNVQRDDLLVVW